MSAPAPPPPSFVPPLPPFGFPTDNDQSRQPDFQPFKKLRTFDDNSIPIKNPRMPPPARGVSRIFFKTRPCEKFRDGTCPFGSNCNFAHGMEDMRKPPPNWQEIVGVHVDERIEKYEEDLNIINRHRLCKNFYNGKVCPFGARCNYRHEDPAKFREEAGRFRESSAISISTTAAPLDNGGRSDKSDNVITLNPNLDVNRVFSKPVPWKTRMCNKWWETSGNCPFGDKCHFAHGAAELKKYGGHNEAEMGNISTAPPKPFVSPFNDVSLTNPVVGVPCKKPVLSKFLLKWKGPEKISRIYADWIDDIPPTKGSPSKLES